MKQEKRIYLAIDLKSFYASVECVDRQLDPLTTNLVVADTSKTTKTICLAVTPSLKQYGISGRARLFQVEQTVKELNAQRLRACRTHRFVGSSYDDAALAQHPDWELTYIAAPPRMAYYLECSTKIHEIYLRYVSQEDMHVYSIDEVFIDATSYLRASGMTPREFAKRIISDIYQSTGITATAGIGTNLYLCKVAMDIVAKHIKADQDGVRIAQLDETRYRTLLWKHRPMTDFWRVGKGYAKRLAQVGITTMGEVAACSIGPADAYYNEELLYGLFGVNAELLIDHAWGYESCTMADIKAYKPADHSIGTGQVLSSPYDADKARLIVREMMDVLALNLVEKHLVCDQVILYIGYDIENVVEENPHVEEITTDFYGRSVPKHAQGYANLDRFSASSKLMTQATMKLYDRIVNPHLTIRRINIAANHIRKEEEVSSVSSDAQLDLFVDYEALERQQEKEQVELEKEKRLQQAALQIQKRYGKNAVLKGMNLEEGATTKERNQMIGGHKA